MCASKLSDVTWINLFFASEPVRRELSVLLTTDKILNLQTSWYVKYSLFRCYYAADDTANHIC